MLHIQASKSCLVGLAVTAVPASASITQAATVLSATKADVSFPSVEASLRKLTVTCGKGCLHQRGRVAAKQQTAQTARVGLHGR